MDKIETLAKRIIKDLGLNVHRNSSEVIIGSHRKRIETFKKNYLFELPGIEDLLKPKTYEHLMALSIPEQKELPHVLFKLIPTGDEKKQKYAEESMSDQQKTLLDGFIVCRESLSNEFVLFDKEERMLSDWLSPEALLDSLPPPIAVTLRRNAPLSQVTFDAYDIKPFKKTVKGGVSVIKLNAYTPPEWQKKFSKAKSEWIEEPPELFSRFLERLVPKESERILVIDWIANALIRRNQSYLSLRGARGNGKTLFMKLIMAVVGHHYFAKDGINKDGFNADMKHKRIVGIDDDTFIGSYAGHRLRKQLTNTSVTYNAKFVQTKKSEKQYASYIIASNDEDAFFVTHEERKIVSVSLTEDNATEFLNSKERDFIDTLPKDIPSDFKEKDLSFLAHLGHWLLNYARVNAEKMHSPHTQYGGGTFWEDVVKSLSLISRLAVEKALSGEHDKVYYDELIMEFDEYKSAGGREVKKRFPSLARELLRFRYGESNDRLFVGADDKDLTLTVSKKYFKGEEDEDLDI